MKKFACLALAVSAAAIAMPAAAQVTGTINVTGHVDGKCAVRTSGAATFSDTVDLGELSQSNGTLRTDLATVFGTSHTYSVVCTSAAPTITVETQPLIAASQRTGDYTSTAPASGYANLVNFTSAVVVTKAVGGDTSPFTDSSAVVAASGPTAIGGALANAAGNIKVTTSGYTTGAGTELLMADPSYAGKIIITIAPGA